MKIRRISSTNRQRRVLLQLFTTTVAIVTVTAVVTVVVTAVVVNIITVATARTTTTTVITVVAIVTVIAVTAITTIAARGLIVIILLTIFKHFLILLHKRHNRSVIRIARNFFTIFHDTATTTELLILVVASSTGREGFRILVTLTTALNEHYVSRVRHNRRVTNLVNLLTQLTTDRVKLIIVTAAANTSQFNLILPNVINRKGQRVRLQFHNDQD